MAKDPNWTITIEPPFSGLVPSYFANTYPFYGNKNQFASLADIDLIDPNVLTQGPGIAALTNGTQAGVVTTLIKGMLAGVTSSDVSFGIGGAKLYKYSASAVASDGTFPHIIDKVTVTGEDGEDVAFYKSKVFYSYNHSGSAGDVGSYDLSSTLDDDYFSTLEGGAALQSAPHQMVVMAGDILAIANGIYIATLDGTTPDPTALDFSTGSQVASIAADGDYLMIAVNYPNVAGSNFCASSIQWWDGSSAFVESNIIPVNGRIGALYIKNGVKFAWWQESGQSNRYNFGYVNGVSLKTIKQMSGTLPLYYQVKEYKGFLVWVSDGIIYLWGGGDIDNPVKLFPYTSTGYTNAGGISAAFGSLMHASYATTNFILCKESGYSIAGSGKTKAFNIEHSVIDSIFVQTEQMSAGAKVDFTLYYDYAKHNKVLTQIAYSTSNYTLHKILNKGVLAENFQLGWSFANGSQSNPVKVRSILVNGHYVPNN